MNKSMTKESVASEFSAASQRDMNLAAPASVESKFKAAPRANALNAVSGPVRNGKPKEFDAAADRGKAISAASGFKPTSLSK